MLLLINENLAILLYNFQTFVFNVYVFEYMKCQDEMKIYNIF